MRRWAMQRWQGLCRQRMRACCGAPCATTTGTLPHSTTTWLTFWSSRLIWLNACTSDHSHSCRMLLQTARNLLEAAVKLMEGFIYNARHVTYAISWCTKQSFACNHCAVILCKSRCIA